MSTQTNTEQQVEYSFSDDTIAAIVKLLQFGLLSGTDVTDHFRRLRLQSDEMNQLSPSSQWVEMFTKEMLELNDTVVTRAHERSTLN
jgi:hypothetical protein